MAICMELADVHNGLFWWFDRLAGYVSAKPNHEYRYCPFMDSQMDRGIQLDIVDSGLSWL